MGEIASLNTCPLPYTTENSMQDLSLLRDKLREQYPRYQHWEKFKILETELSTVSRYINICENNLKTHSFELSALILRACTDVEIIRKRMTEKKITGARQRDCLSYIPTSVMLKFFCPCGRLRLHRGKVFRIVSLTGGRPTKI